jgi:hypothetical protein
MLQDYENRVKKEYNINDQISIIQKIKETPFSKRPLPEEDASSIGRSTYRSKSGSRSQRGRSNPRSMQGPIKDRLEQSQNVE